MNKAAALAVMFALMASTVFAQTGDAIFSQSYTLGLCDQQVQALSLSDDFVPVQDGEINTVVLWMVLLGGQPGNLTMTIAEDLGSSDPNTAETVYSGAVGASYQDTGDDFGGNDVYQVTLGLPSNVAVEATSSYWLEINMPVSGYWLGQQPVVFGSSIWALTGSTWDTSQNVFGFDMDAFFDLYMPVALNRDSWAAIKYTF